jgi:hypothetical protein
VTVDEKRLIRAYGDYVKNVADLTETIESRDPDHYKRAGALLHALNANRPITAVKVLSDIELTDLAKEPLSETATAEHVFGKFYETYYNEVGAFDICYSLCCLYEGSKRKPTWDYLETVCAYLNNVRDAPVDSYFMLFKSLMQFIQVPAYAPQPSPAAP